MNDLTRYDPQENAIAIANTTETSAIRDNAIRSLQHVPSIINGLRKLTRPASFRVIVSSENARLFRQAADGTYKPFLRSGGKFVENVDLRKLSPDRLGAISSLLMSVNMAAIAADLSAIKADVHDLGRLFSDTTRGGVNGAINTVHQAEALTDVAERRRESLGACRDLSVELGKLIGQLGSHVRAMPELKNGIFDGWVGPGLDVVRAKWREVEEDLVLLKDSLATLLRTYGNLGEPGAAREALLGIVKGLQAANLPAAARKARLVPMPLQGMAPEALILRVSEAVSTIEQRLLAPKAPSLLPIMIDLRSEELDLCQMPREPAPAGAS